MKPWCVANNTERLDPENGLLLTPNLDRAFDSGLITFDTENKGKLLLSKAFRNPETLGITDDLRLTKLTARTENHLKFHRKQVFLSEADLGLKG
ncbi:MAG: HNH endonuclease [Sutterella sp.]|nr:HNH endonuclease [Sutterella sp.]